VAKPAFFFTMREPAFLRALGMSRASQCEDVGSSAGKQREERCPFFAPRPLIFSACRRTRLTSGGSPSAARSISGGGAGGSKVGFDPTTGKNAPRFIEQAPAAFAAVAGVRIVNQKSVSRSESHR
jgi:hypothetical protein